MRTYELYSTGPGDVFSNGKRYQSGDWIFQVRASSIRAAYYFVANQIVQSRPGGPGIEYLSNAQGPPTRWPWKEALWLATNPLWHSARVVFLSKTLQKREAQTSAKSTPKAPSNTKQ